MIRWIKNLFVRQTFSIEQELEAQRAQVAGLMGHTERQLSASFERRGA